MTQICVYCGAICQDWEQNLHALCVEKMRDKHNDFVKVLEEMLDNLKRIEKEQEKK